uniref:Uncharacterized protein n=1 Tax=Anguilla anguilla TaxID=7936 RepID=A0A0E9T0K2_ANGAN
MDDRTTRHSTEKISRGVGTQTVCCNHGQHPPLLNIRSLCHKPMRAIGYCSQTRMKLGTVIYLDTSFFNGHVSLCAVGSQ